MSLKAVHITFIVLSIALTVGFGYREVRIYTATENALSLYSALASLAAAAALSFYLLRFIQKMKKIRPLSAWILAPVLLSPRSLFACSVCFGDPQSGLSRGVVAGVLVLLGVVAFVLAWIAILIFVWSRKGRKISGIGPVLDPHLPLD